MELKFTITHMIVLGLASGLVVLLHAPPPRLLNSTSVNHSDMVRLRFQSKTRNKLQFDRIKKIFLLPECDSCSLRSLDLNEVAENEQRGAGTETVLLVVPWKFESSQESEIPEILSKQIVYLDEIEGIDSSKFVFAPIIYEVQKRINGEVNILEGIER